MSRRVLVTGARGFIGRHLLALLAARGDDVHAVATTPASHASAEAVTWHVADLLSQGTATRLLGDVRPECLVHLAWYTEHGSYWEASTNLSWVGATLELLRGFADGGGERAVCAGTCAEYAWTQSPCVEGTTPLEPTTLYGLAKDATRRVAGGLAERIPFELAWGRPFLLYGPGEDERRLIAYVARALLEGRPADVGDGALVRDFLHVEDVAGAFAAILDSDVCGPVNVASGVGVTLRDAIELVAQAAGTPELVRFGSVPARPGDPRELVGSVARLREGTQFVPRIPLESGIAATVDWWRSQLREGRSQSRGS